MISSPSSATVSPAPTWTLPVKYGQGQFSHFDRFVVVNDITGIAAEGHGRVEKANRACGILNAHNIQNGHAARFEVQAIPEQWHNQPPARWK